MTTTTTEDTTNGKETHANNDIGKSSGNIFGKNGKSGNIACKRPTHNSSGLSASVNRPARIPATFRQHSGNKFGNARYRHATRRAAPSLQGKGVGG